MIVHKDKRFDKLLARLHLAGGHASLAAGNAEQIIESLRNRGIVDLSEAGRQTKYGEKRLKNCVKFNLGNGYRLISVRRHERMQLLFIGSHDQCDVWLDKNQGRFFSPTDHDRQSGRTLAGSSAVNGDREPDNDSKRDEYENLLLQKIDDKLLRRIFRGLLRNNAELFRNESAGR